MNNKLCVVIVTYNRLEKLKKALSSYENQSLLPNIILIFNNGSTDETNVFLNKWQQQKTNYKKIIINSTENKGGSGGFYFALKEAQNYDCDWIWVSDDDAYPEKNSLELITNDIKKFPNIKIFTTKVIEHQRIAYTHRRFVIPSKIKYKEMDSSEKNYKAKFFNHDIFSFVGICLNKEVLNVCGLPNKDFFIWYDDTEYSLRVRKHFEILCDTSICIIHDTENIISSPISWKTYYGYRNQYYSMKKHLSGIKLYTYYLSYQKIILIKFFKDKKYFTILKKAKRDAKIGKLGLSADFLPGSKI